MKHANRVNDVLFKVAYIWIEDAFLVCRGGIHVGTPTWFTTREAAEKQADFLNAQHGLGEKNNGK